jgi:hypothetical protein
MVRRYGRIPRGERLTASLPHGHWKTTVFLAALRADAITAPSVIGGAANRQTFPALVQQFLVQNLAPGDVVVMDDLRSREVGGVREAIVAQGRRANGRRTRRCDRRRPGNLLSRPMEPLLRQRGMPLTPERDPLP